MKSNLPKLRLLGALLAGSLLPFAFAPVNLWWLAILSPALLLAIWEGQTADQASRQGFIYGLSTFGIGISWVFISIHEYGHMALPLALVSTALFIMLLALFPAGLGYLLQRCLSNNSLARNLFAFPTLWVLLEALRGWLLTGFPWLFLSYSQVNSPLAGFAPILGGIGLSWLTALCSGIIYTAVKVISNKANTISTSSNAFKIKASLSAVIILASIFISGKLLLQHAWTQPYGSTLQVSLIQGNIPQELKWNEEQAAPTLKRYFDLTQQVWDSDIIIWPEAAIPLLKEEVQDYLAVLENQAKKHHTALLAGIPIQEQAHFYNGLIALGNAQGTYYKRHLVPFGEYLPFTWLRGTLDFFDIPMSDFSPGAAQQPLIQAANILIAPFICYEIAYSELVRQSLPQAHLLVTISNDAWFGHSFAAAQHLQIAQLRSLESGRYGLMSTNTGLTAIITPQGRLQAVAPSFDYTVLTGHVQPMQGTTPWVKWGDKPLLLLSTSLLILIKLYTLLRNYFSSLIKP